MVVLFRKVTPEEFPEPLTWTIWSEAKQMDGTVTRMVVGCDPMGQPFAIQGQRPGHDWNIAADGTVTPSVNIPPSGNHPGWHDFVKLEGWEG